MTTSSRNRLRPVMMSSVMPSAKYSWAGSLDMFAKGSTAIEGLLVPVLGDLIAAGTAPTTRYARTGSAIFFKTCAPISSNPALILFLM